MSEDSYIYVEDNKTVRVQCVECHEKNNLGELWSASNGYGPWDFICKCGKVIHRHKGKDENTTSVQDTRG